MEISSRKPKLLGASITSTATSEGIDRISYLPDDIIHNILSFLYIFDVVQLSVLSKRWNHIWRTMPYFQFDIVGYSSERVQQPCSWEMAHKFNNFINWVLISQCTTSLVRFKLCSTNFFDNPTIFRWIQVTTRRNVQELVLSVRLDEPFELPCCVSICESLKVLKLNLSGAVLKLPNHLGFHQLKLLHLVEVELSNEHLTSCFFSNSPLLEKLVLGDCTFGTMKVLYIASTSLVNVSIIGYNCGGGIYKGGCVKISCLNLKVLKYNAPAAKDIILENLCSIEVVHIFFFNVSYPIEEIGMLVHKMIKNVPSTPVLKLSMIRVRGLYRIPHEVKNSPVTFYKLKCLKLAVGIDEECMQGMILLLKHSPNLEVLSLWSDENDGWNENWELHDPSESIVCMESHLKLIELTGFKYEENEIELLRFFLKNARVLENLIVVLADHCIWDDYAEISNEASEVVLKYPRTSSRVVVTFHDVNPKRKSSCLYNVF